MSAHLTQDEAFFCIEETTQGDWGVPYNQRPTSKSNLPTHSLLWRSLTIDLLDSNAHYLWRFHQLLPLVFSWLGSGLTSKKVNSHCHSPEDRSCDRVWPRSHHWPLPGLSFYSLPFSSSSSLSTTPPSSVLLPISYHIHHCLLHCSSSPSIYSLMCGRALEQQLTPLTAMYERSCISAATKINFLLWTLTLMIQ